jgi:hypothetical protein
MRGNLPILDAAKVKVYVASSVGIDYFFFLAKTIRAAGYDVREIYLISEDSYRRQAKTSGLRKLWLRAQMYLVYPGYLIVEGLRCRKSSVFVVSSNTFYAPYLVHLLLQLRGIRVVHMLYDLFPDALEIAGGLSTTSWASRAIGVIARRNQSCCDGTVYLGDFLKRHAEARWGRTSRSEVIDISTDLSLYEQTFPELTRSGPLIIHYGGQLGHLHDARSIIASVQHLCRSDLSASIRFNFYVSGAQAQFLRESLRGYPVEVIATAPSSQWRQDIRGFHVGLVSLSPGGASVCLPSKTYAMMAGGMAILAIAPIWSDLANLVTTLQAGWVINNSRHVREPGSSEPGQLEALREPRDTAAIVEQFEATIRHILLHREELEVRRRAAFQGVRSRYGIENLQEKWHHLLSSLEPASGRWE